MAPAPLRARPQSRAPGATRSRHDLRRIASDWRLRGADKGANHPAAQRSTTGVEARYPRPPPDIGG